MHIQILHPISFNSLHSSQFSGIGFHFFIWFSHTLHLTFSKVRFCKNLYLLQLQIIIFHICTLLGHEHLTFFSKRTIMRLNVRMSFTWFHFFKWAQLISKVQEKLPKVIFMMLIHFMFLKLSHKIFEFHYYSYNLLASPCILKNIWYSRKIFIQHHGYLKLME